MLGKEVGKKKEKKFGHGLLVGEGVGGCLSLMNCAGMKGKKKRREEMYMGSKQESKRDHGLSKESREDEVVVVMKINPEDATQDNGNERNHCKRRAGVSSSVRNKTKGNEKRLRRR